MVEILQAKIDQTKYWDLTIITAKIICKDINVEMVSNSTLNFFWWEGEDPAE